MKKNCEGCDKPRVVSKSKKTGKMLCRACKNNLRLGECEECHTLAPVVVRKSDRAIICRKCQGKAYSADCSFCGNFRKIAKRFEDGRCACKVCHAKHFNHRECAVCGNVKRISKITVHGEDICTACYRREFNRCICWICDKVGRVATRLSNGEPICVPCSREGRERKRVIEECALCHLPGEISLRLDIGGVCIKCYKQNFLVDICTMCGDLKTIQCRIDDKPYCHACSSIKRTARCPSCSRVLPLTYTSPDGYVCYNCRRPGSQASKKKRKRKKKTASKKSSTKPSANYH